MQRLLATTISFVFICGVATPMVAQAQPKHRVVARIVSAPPLVVRQRNWLDSGNVVPVGTENAYLAEATSLNQQTYASYLPGKFGQSTLPGRFDLAVPGNPRGPESGGIFSDD